MTNIVPVMDKDTIRYITQNITPEEAEYVQGIKSTLDDTKADDNNCDDIIYLTKLMAFIEKFKTLNWNSSNCAYKDTINCFVWQLEDYKTKIAEYIQSIIGEIKGSAITKLTLPISDNPLEVINEVKICVQNWFTCHQDNIEYEGARYLTSQILAEIHRNVYLFRLCKVSDKDYVKCTECSDCKSAPETFLKF